MFFLSIILILAATVFISASLRFSSKFSYLLSFYLFSFANITLTGHLGHSLSLLNSEIFYLVFEALLLGVTILVWLKCGKPTILGPFKHSRLKLKRNWLITNLDLILFAIGVTAAMGIAAYLWHLVPPNNNDSLSTHMVRVLYWLQHGNYHPWPTQRTWQVIYPVNAQLNILWTILFTGADQFVGLIQWSAGIFSAICVMGLASELKAKRTGAIFAGLIFLTYPIVALQTTTTQNGLVATALFGISFYYFFRSISQQSNKLLILSGISLGIAVGTKQTVLFLLPGWGIAMLLLWLAYKKITFKKLSIWAASVTVAFLVLGSQIFFINLKQYGHPLGPKNTVQTSTAPFSSIENSLSQVTINSTRFLYQLADPSGLPSPFWRWGIKARAIAGKVVFDVLNLPVESNLFRAPAHEFSLEKACLLQEDEAWFGLIGFFAIVPTLLIMTIHYLKKKEPLSISIFLVTIGFFITDTLLRPGWDPYQGRYFMPVALLCTALLALWFNHKILRWIIGPLSLLIGLSILFNVMLFNPVKAILTKPVAYYYRYPADPGYEELSNFQPAAKLSRLENLTIQTRSNLYVCQFIDEKVPPNAVMGYASNANYFQEYCYFGETLDRTIIPIHPGSMLYNEQELLELNIEFIFLYLFEEDQLPLFTHYNLISSDNNRGLFLYQLTN
ncbi:MAG: glycosyltransferase family 39 protein [Anaerolineaceae bacterium]|nr:glycosyltransferase family 39 protein [Anaerolineaceae bacterium]